MNKSNIFFCEREKGFGTLTISVIVLLLLTITTLYATRSTITERQIVANQYRSDQALSAANAAMDYAIAYYNEKGDFYQNGYTDSNGNPIPDFTSTQPKVVSIVDAAGDLLVEAEVFVDDSSDEGYSLVAKGQSDDKSAIRKLQVMVTDIGLIGDGEGGPDFPVISRDIVQTSGNITIINRYTHKGVWSGADETTWGSAGTFLAHPGYPKTSWTDAKLVDPNTNNAWTMEGSKSSTGINSDIISGDPNLANLTGDDFFGNFIGGTKTLIRSFANNRDQLFNGSSVDWDSDLAGKVKGIVWVDGNWDIAGAHGTVGTRKAPVLLIVDGDLKTTGFAGSCNSPADISLYGILYVVGTWTTKGNICIQGSAITEGAMTEGGGNPTVIFDPKLFQPGDGLIPIGARGVITGSWRDWD